MDEEEIIKRIKDGETELFSHIVNKYKKVVYNHAVSFLRNFQDAEDAAQEVFINVFNYLPKFRGDSKIGTWIYRITVNVCTNRLKQIKRRQSRMLDRTKEDEENIGSLLEAVAEKEDKKPDNILVTSELREMVFRRINELSDEQKQVIIMRDINGLSYEETARVMKISESAVKSKLFRAREKLREKLEKDDVL
ncbi:MAG: RNA polymerase sigma factor [Candidatus Goldiibacteriota bacterium]